MAAAHAQVAENSQPRDASDIDAGLLTLEATRHQDAEWDEHTAHQGDEKVHMRTTP